ncbi:hypothetical protein [Anaeromyxobacter diazotrophicus]|uniref:Bacterial virulence factor lipase N-terminal domain-containing protein n=1 Tax=Anaeromyxobacter diazotrophicus TaxID=2590199 RepID=A0A7I9VMS1_9BACT|nr:hypothetical protein [Anaeromyxobacter diazotrophicus]GEJ57702.1 hypothetical protein AMYX_24430 [Anaeromyxobacter diazotrophicus]
MHRRRLLTVASAAAALAACAPSIDKHTNPASTDYVLFDPSVSEIPLPNDLALQPTSIAATTGAQQELLQSFAAQGGFPNDQEAPITIDVQRDTYSGNTITKGPPPDGVDLATVKLVGAVPSGANVALFEKKAGATTPAPVPPNTYAVTYVQSADRGTITIRNNLHDVTLSPGETIKSQRWNAGSQYIVLVRGGASGVKLKGGGELVAQPTMYLLTRGVDLSLAENEYLLPGSGRVGRAATGAQLEALRQQYLPLFGLAEQAFGAGASKDLVSVQTFQIAPAKAGAAVVTDASAGVVPLPSDLLLDPATGGKTIVNNPAFGALASGIATLDGFSTTAMELTQTSAPVVASTVSASSVFLYDLSNPAAPVRLKEVKETISAGGAGAAFVAEPYQMTVKPTGATTTAACGPTDDPAGCFSPAIGLQPAVPVPLGATGPYLALPPLKEGTEYAVLITDGVLSAPATVGGAKPPLQGSTLSRILLFDSPLVDKDGKSQVPGQSDATAAGLEQIRQGVGAAAKALQAEKGIAKSHVVLGYTFRTQTITDASLRLAAYPYSAASKFVPGAKVDVTATLKGAATAKGIPTTGVQAFWTVPFFTKNPIDVATGALNPDNSKWTDASLTALVVVPNGPKQGAPLVVFQHGLTGDKGNVLAIASTLASAGFVTAAIDAPLHGDRAYCKADAECVCAAGGTGCNPKCNLFPAGAQGDTASGVCSAGAVPCSGTLVSAGACTTSVSGNFFVSGNLFRTRDALRESILDTSALVLALAPPSTPSGTFATDLAAAGVTIDPSKVYWVGQSLGGILGTLNTAANPRISKAVLNVPGGTLTDVFTQSPTFAPQLTPILTSLGITVGTPQYLQFLQVAKLALDGGDPVNFGGHLTGDTAHPTLKDLLASKPNQSAKSVFGQVATGDTVIPNPFNYELLGNVFTSPQPDLTKSASNVSTYSSGGGAATHGFLLDFTNPTLTLTAQGDAAAFLTAGTLPPAAQNK